MKSQFGTIIVEVILFIVAAVASYILISSAYNSLNKISNAAYANAESLQNMLQTYITIDSCAYNSTTNLLYVYVTNRGNNILNQNLTQFFVNGVLVNNKTVRIAYSYTGTQVWGPYDTIVIISNISLGTDFYQVKVVADSGAFAQNIIYVNTTANTCIVK
ncbi:MAG: hypothetical protein ACPLX8_00185 [Nanopusillaceae archaeon]